MWPNPPPHTPAPEPEPVAPLTLDELEAEARRKIAKAASIVPRGFDTRRDKDDAIREADSAIDSYNAAREVAELENLLPDA